jgi:hypothetical protein
MMGGGGVTGLDKLRATGTSTTGSSEEEEEEYSRQIGWGEDETGRGVVYRGRAGGEAIPSQQLTLTFTCLASYSFHS